MPRVSDRLQVHKALIEEYLLGLEFSENPRLAVLIEAMRYSFLGEGGRLRPVLCMEVARAFGLDPTEVLPSAAAIELIHTLSRVHGDQPAIGAVGSGGSGSTEPATYMEFGEATAILAGDAFFGESLALITNHQKGSAGQLLQVVRELATSTGANGMIGGQVLDLGRRERPIDSEEFHALHGYKTGALVEASARIGAILAGASDEDQEIISRYALNLGLCRRIVNDILEAAREAGGVPNRATSFVGVYGLAEAWTQADRALEDSLESLAAIDADTSGLATLAHLTHGRIRQSR